MACTMFSIAPQPSLTRIPSMRIDKSQAKMAGLVNLSQVLNGKTLVRSGSSRVFCHAPSLEKEFSALQSNNVAVDEDNGIHRLLEEKEEVDRVLTNNEELKTLLADAQRMGLVNKLSEANQQNQSLKRQLKAMEDVLVQFKNELAVVESEILALVVLTAGIAKSDILEASRKINYLHCKLETVHKRLKDQVKDVDGVQLREVQLCWHGMAENVRVMGSFDAWSLGEDLSPESTGAHTVFSTTLMLRPGRYEIKFMVDNEWRLSPEFPTDGEGVMRNNLLIVE